MSQIRITIIDAKRAITGIVHGSYGHIITASLTAEPETVDELEIAVRRFVEPQSDWPALYFLARGEDFEPFDAGLLVVDLVSRTIVSANSYDHFGVSGQVAVDTLEDDRLPIPYQLSDDWKCVKSLPELEWRRRRSGMRSIAKRRFDARGILFGPTLSEFVFKEAKTAQDPEAVVSIHADWLMKPQDALAGKTPRDVFFERREFINRDLESRSLQWSVTGKETPPLANATSAYRFAGFGTHSFVVHYDYFRYLYEVAASGEVNDAQALFEAGAKWLHEPRMEFAGRLPIDILEAERRRVNLTTRPDEFPISDDCEICRMMAAEFDTPMFWHLDGSNMEFDRFEFSYHQNRADWEREMAEWEERSARWEREKIDIINQGLQ